MSWVSIATKLALYLLAALVAVHGCVLMRGPYGRNRMVEQELEAGAPFLLIAVIIWLLAELLGEWSNLRSWWQGLSQLRRHKWMARVIPLLLGIAGNSLLIKSMSAPTDVSLGLVVKAAERFALACFIILLIEALPLWIRRNNRNLAQFLGWIDDQRALPASVPHISAPGNAQRPKNLIRHSNVLFFVLAALVSRFVWLNSASNIFRPPIIALWVLSAVLWALAFAGVGWSGISGFGNAVARDWTVPLRKYWWAFVASRSS